MVFNSVIFIFCFLPIFLLIYYFVPARARNPVLFAGSLFFYAWGDPTYLVLMLFSSFFNYYMGKELGKITDEDPSRKRNLIFAVVINLLILGFFKYWGFFLDAISGVTGLKLTYPQLALPIGLSFYTFKNLSYILDIYMGKTEPCKGFFPYAVYSTMFPHMTAGPIVRYTDISESISRRSINTTRLGAGAELFIKGLSKKVLLADNLSALYTTLQASGTTSFVGTWLAIGAYTLELYFDFSGYSDMAIGLGKMFGFEFQENFNYPYTAGSVQEFWHRWHISLSSWFRDYVYIPLGGNRKGAACTYRNLLIVFFLTGMWHGAGMAFILWGLYHGFFLILERVWLGKKLEKLPGIVGWGYTVTAVFFGWILFRAENISLFFTYVRNMFVAHGGTILLSAYLDSKMIFLIVMGVLFAGVLQKIYEKVRVHSAGKIPANGMVTVPRMIACMVIFWLSVAALVNNSYNPFIYFRF